MLKYRVYQPWISKNQNKYLFESLENNELTYRGRFEGMFEAALKEYLGVRNVILTSNGTTALYAAYREVFNFTPKTLIAVSTITYAATVSQLKLVGFTPLYLDVDENFQVNLDQLESAGKASCVQGVVVPELYANSPNMNRLVEICDKYKLPLVEDAAESFACWNKMSEAEYKTIGSYGKAGTFSFFANKVITSGEGGCVVTDDDELANRIRKFCNHNTAGGYKHDGLGCNFRMTNFQAAIGLAQLEDVDIIVKRKQDIARYYRHNLKFDAIYPDGLDISSEWMPVFKLKTQSYQKFKEYCESKGVEVRPSFYPLHSMPEFDGYCPFSLDIANNSIDRHFILPCYPALTDDDLKYIVEVVNNFNE